MLKGVLGYGIYLANGVVAEVKQAASVFRYWRPQRASGLPVADTPNEHIAQSSPRHCPV